MDKSECTESKKGVPVTKAIVEMSTALETSILKHIIF